MDAIAWATETFAPMNLTWTALDSVKKHPKDAHIQGLTADKAAGLDLIVTDKSIRLATCITPINAAYMPLCVFAIAAIAGTDKPMADKWLARMLDQLRRQRHKETQATLKQIKGIGSITTLGVFTLQLMPR